MGRAPPHPDLCAEVHERGWGANHLQQQSNPDDQAALNRLTHRGVGEWRGALLFRFAGLLVRFYPSEQLAVVSTPPTAYFAPAHSQRLPLHVGCSSPPCRQPSSPQPRPAPGTSIMLGRALSAAGSRFASLRYRAPTNVHSADQQLRRLGTAAPSPLYSPGRRSGSPDVPQRSKPSGLVILPAPLAAAGGAKRVGNMHSLHQRANPRPWRGVRGWRVPPPAAAAGSNIAMILALSWQGSIHSAVVSTRKDAGCPLRVMDGRQRR